MSGSSKIEWTEATWNPLTGCTLVSEGCRNCYAAREAAGRLSHLPQYEGLAKKVGGRPVFTGEVRLHEDRLDQPLRWRKPRRVFVNSMSDLFHEAVPFEFIDQVWEVMAQTRGRHTFQILTKRPERMAVIVPRLMEKYRLWEGEWPLPNVWLGTSVEDQASADKRIPHLLATPAAVRFLSCEPLLGPVNLRQIRGLEEDSVLYFPLAGEVTFETRNEPLPLSGGGIHWVIAGGESGPKARPMHPDWARLLRDQCVDAGVPFFFKQWGEWRPDSRPFGTFIQWINKAETWVDPGDTCLDHQGRRLATGADFEGAVYPVAIMRRVGKKVAGRELDGRTWDEMPEVPR